MGRMRVADVMTEAVITIRPAAPIAEAAEVMLLHHVSGLPVTDADGKLVGIVTEGDLVEREAGPGERKHGVLSRLREPTDGAAPVKTVADVMTKDPVLASPREEVHRAARRMVRAGVNRLPVVKNDTLVGIVSRHDVITVFDRADEDLRDAVAVFLRENLFVRPDAEIAVSVDDGVATLTGKVRYEGDVRVAGSLAASIDGVLDVENRLTFERPDLKMTGHGISAAT